MPPAEEQSSAAAGSPYGEAYLRSLLDGPESVPPPLRGLYEHSAFDAPAVAHGAPPLVPRQVIPPSSPPHVPTPAWQARAATVAQRAQRPVWPPREGKSPWIGALLALCFGPLGLLYVSGKVAVAGLVTFVVGAAVHEDLVGVLWIAGVLVGYGGVLAQQTSPPRRH